MWWPETDLNRRRQPFQGAYRYKLTRLESMKVCAGKGVMLKASQYRLGWSGSFSVIRCTQYVPCSDDRIVRGNFAAVKGIWRLLAMSVGAALILGALLLRPGGRKCRSLHCQRMKSTGTTMNEGFYGDWSMERGRN